MLNTLINSQEFNAGGINGNFSAGGIPTELVIIYNQTGIALDWTPYSGAVAYFLQVSLYPDFRTTFVDTTVPLSTHSFTDAQPNGQKRYWRWAPTLDGVEFLTPWSEVGSYWLDTALDEQMTLQRNEWGLANPDDMLDQREFDQFPTYVTVKRNLYRYQDRNRLGELLSEFLTVKGLITLNFTGQQFLEHADLDEVERFHNDFRTFFLAAYKDGGQDNPMPHVWLVELANDPSFAMISAGNPMYLQGSLTFEEV